MECVLSCTGRVSRCTRRAQGGRAAKRHGQSRARAKPRVCGTIGGSLPSVTPSFQEKQRRNKVLRVKNNRIGNQSVGTDVILLQSVVHQSTMLSSETVFFFLKDTSPSSPSRRGLTVARTLSLKHLLMFFRATALRPQHFFGCCFWSKYRVN